MIKDYPGEQWKNIKFDFEYTNDRRMEISNFGRLRSFNKISNGNILKGSMINGYRIIRLKFFKPADRKTILEIDGLRSQVAATAGKLRSLTDKKNIASTSSELSDLKKSLARKVKNAEKKRTIYYQCLVHRLVANYFLKPHSPEHTVVAHIDYNKLNNRAHNLKWMTAEENYAHQKKSPYVIAEKKERIDKRKGNANTKLSVTKVMLLKKLLNQNKPIRQLAKQFKVTDTQIIRIKKGVNWADVKAAT